MERKLNKWFSFRMKLPEGWKPKPAWPLHLQVLQEELVAELVREADLFTRRDSGLQMISPTLVPKRLALLFFLSTQEGCWYVTVGFFLVQCALFF